MKLETSIRTIFNLTSIIIFILFIYFFKQSQWKSNDSIFIQRLKDTMLSNHSDEPMNLRNFSIYKHLLEDLTRHSRWSLSSFLKKSGLNNNGSTLMSKKKICIVSVDTRSLERFSAVNNIEKMNFFSASAYNHLFYGKSTLYII